jgi:hypothetical protein
MLSHRSGFRGNRGESCHTLNKPHYIQLHCLVGGSVQNFWNALALIAYIDCCSCLKRHLFHLALMISINCHSWDIIHLVLLALMSTSAANLSFMAHTSSISFSRVIYIDCLVRLIIHLSPPAVMMYVKCYSRTHLASLFHYSTTTSPHA